jgi:hypothetical protein
LALFAVDGPDHNRPGELAVLAKARRSPSSFSTVNLSFLVGGREVGALGLGPSNSLQASPCKISKSLFLKNFMMFNH